METSKKFSYSFTEERTGILFNISECEENTLKACAEYDDYKYESKPIEFTISETIDIQRINKYFDIYSYREKNSIHLVYLIPAINFRREFILEKERVDANTELLIANRKLVRKITSLEEEIKTIKKTHHFGLIPANEYIEFWIDKNGIFMKGNPELIEKFSSLMDNMQLDENWQKGIINDSLADELRNLKNHRYFLGNQNCYFNILYSIKYIVDNYFPMLFQTFPNINTELWVSSVTENLYEKSLRESGEKSMLLMEILIYYFPVFSVFDTNSQEKKDKYENYKKTNRVKIGNFNHGLVVEITSGVRSGKTILLNHTKV